ncbi:hypothetical protein IVA95_18735 [Bradyrhizobium sp. 157]|uniref:hypothetical protein n=1 Tax=Bradyrhizobium sp. 157 TaxID=2782631 RepID=UPI001FFBC6F7|nr:hypothetical protein [Bradyrhizobium sp. 157]MCK1639595.1 hypothetical protein [Bradyrhizobium sp. 157]
MLDEKYKLPFWLRMALEWAAGIGAWLGGFELIKYFFSDMSARLLSAQLYIVATAVGLAAVIAVREWRTSRKEKYANITGYVEQAAHVLRELQTYMSDNAPEDGATKRQFDEFFEVCKSKVSLVLDQLNLTFVSLTGTRCRTSVKLIYDISGQTYYYTLARDKGSDQKCREMDNRRIEQNHDPLKKNSPFSLLLDDTNNTWHYFCNNLLEDERFSSTSFSAYDPKWGQTGVAPKRRFSKSVEDWPLPYRSTIACTICQSPGPFVSSPKTVVLGFVTVDSESRNVFSERWDVPLVAALANALYHPLKGFLEIQNQMNQMTRFQTQTVTTVEPNPQVSRLAPPASEVTR